MENIEKLDDEELIARYKAGDNNALDLLFGRNKALVSSLARPYFLIGGGTDDLIQEGMIGLHKAIVTYDKDKNVKFHLFAKTCIKRAILDALRIANRDKHRALNDSVPIQLLSDEYGPCVSPEEVVIDEEKYRFLMDKIYSFLSTPQKKLLTLFLHGYSYDEMAKEMNKDIKYVDNTLQIIKRKIRKNLELDK